MFHNIPVLVNFEFSLESKFTVNSFLLPTIKIYCLNIFKLINLQNMFKKNWKKFSKCYNC